MGREATNDAREHRTAGLCARSVRDARQHLDPGRHLVWQAAPDKTTGRTYRQASAVPLVLALLRRGGEEGWREAEAIIASYQESVDLADRPRPLEARPEGALRGARPGQRSTGCARRFCGTTHRDLARRRVARMVTSSYHGQGGWGYALSLCRSFWPAGL